MHSKNQIKFEEANKNTASSKKKKGGEMEVTCKELCLLQIPVKVWDICHCSMMWPVDEWMFLLDWDWVHIPQTCLKNSYWKTQFRNRGRHGKKRQRYNCSLASKLPPSVHKKYCFPKNDALVQIAKIHSFSQIRPKLFLQQYSTSQASLWHRDAACAGADSMKAQTGT